MLRASLLPLALVFVSVSGCGEVLPPAADRGTVLFEAPVVGGNSYACATCHAEREPAADGVRRPGHPLEGVTTRPSYKNGALTELRDAVNSCREEWMRAEPLAEDSADWKALLGYLEGLAPEGATAGEAITYEIVAPPADLSGGDADAGNELFNRTCVACHGEDARGTVRGPSLVGSKLDAEKIAERVRLSGDPESGVYEGLTGGAMPFWSKERLSDAELRDLVAYTEAIGAEDDGVDGGDGGDDGETRFCESTHEKVGQIAVLSTFSHDVSGIAEIVNDCTIRIQSFTYDGGGIDVRVYGGLGGDYEAPVGFPISPNLIGRGFNGETYTVQLPEGRTLDDLDGISIWCVDVSVSFGDGLFQ